ncbi:phospholipid-transporting ATPase ABCA3-like [Sycon ciliatum]|uniref:phospholipid-transporting ATPase ABCA3-like n=1 Tax=Sycon ciliatum TaxID=27933 RepID=UPI0031F70310
MGKLRQLRLLLWKNFLLQIRRPVGAVVEILLPILACAVMIAIRQVIKPQDRCFRSCSDIDLHYRASRINVLNSSAPVVGYYPDTPLARRIMETASCMSSGMYVEYNSSFFNETVTNETFFTINNTLNFLGQPFQIRAYNSSTLLERDATVSLDQTDVLGGIVFEDIENSATVTRLPRNMEYAIRLRPSAAGGRNQDGPSWRTRRQEPVFERTGVVRYVVYDVTFAPLQYIIDQAIVRTQVEEGGQCKLNSTQCPDVSQVTTTCTFTRDSDQRQFSVQFDSTDEDYVPKLFPNLLTCSCTRTSFLSSNMLKTYSASCSCDVPGSEVCISNGPVELSCCGRCDNSPKNKTFLPVVAKNFPYPNYRDDTFLTIAGFMISLLFVLALIYPAGMFVRELVLEKQSRMRETMKMMGLSTWINYLSWFIKQVLQFFIAALFCTIIIVGGKVFPESSGILLFLFFLVYFIVSVLFLFMLAAIFSDPRVAMISSFAIWFVSYVPYLATSAMYDEMSTDAKAGVCFFFSNSALGMAMFQYSRREVATEGVQFSNAHEGLSVEDGFTMAHIFGMLILNGVLYLLIIWYVENVFPGDYGIPKPFYFFLQKSYWLGVGDSDGEDEVEEAGDEGAQENHEEEPVGVTVGIGIRNLRKVYHTGGKSKVAVENLNLNMYSGQITSLLGHNGAGKTTTMSMLVGLFPPSSGDASIHGHSVRTDIEKVRESLGLCPQHNVLYDALTVEEHLRFFLELKTGRRGVEAKGEIADMIQDLQLEDKTNWKAAELSGGMKRKLSVAIALIGGSKVVVLDEPTSGMDPYARRATWDLLLKHKEGRTMLLTTHFMDEADLLGDRIAIMANGQLVCSGSSLFLKTKFGVGYHLTVVKKNDQTESGKGALVNSVTKFVPGGRLVGDIGAEMSFVLPHDGVDSFCTLFSDLEAKSAEYGISSFGVSVTTMEEVFHRAGESADVTLESRLERRNSVVKRQYSQLSYEREEHDAADLPQQPQAMENMDMTSDLLQGSSLWFQQFRGMFTKRFLTSIRHPTVIVLQLLFPIVLTICALLVIKLVPTIRSDPDLTLKFSNLKFTRAYTADYRDSPTCPDPVCKRTPLNTSSPGFGYLSNPSNIEPMDITADSVRFSPGNASPDCCSENFILHESCIAERYANVTYFGGQGNLGVFSSCGESFGYKECSVCLNARATLNGRRRLDTATLAREFSGSCEDNDQCPSAPTLTAARRQTTWFQARVLENANTGDYFKEWQSGYSLHSGDGSDLPDAVRGDGRAMDIEANCYQEIAVPCDQPDPLKTISYGNSPNCTAYLPVPSCFQTAYDPEGYNMYARVWHSAKGIHTLPYAVNTWSNMHLRNTLNDASYSITTVNSPLDKTVEDQAEAVSSDGGSLSFGIVATLGMSFLTASFAFNPIDEYRSKSKHIQFVSGVHISVYWVANYVWDMINYLIPLVFLMIVYAAFDIDAFKGSNFGAVVVLLLLFGWSGIPLGYLWSFLFSNPLVGYGTIAFFQFILGLVYLVVVFILQISTSVSQAATDTTRRVFFTLPHYSLSQGLTDIFQNYETRAVCDQLPTMAELLASTVTTGARLQSREACYYARRVRSDVFDWDEPGVGKEVVYMALAGPVFFSLTLLVEYFLRLNFSSASKRPCDLQPTEGEDDDVAAERRRIEAMGFPSESDNDLVIMKNLTKSYSGSKLGRPSADNLCLGIPAGECFGLLGVNGAGKTTTFNMLTGDVLPTYGTAFLSGFDVRNQLREVQQRIGYCPQFDALCEKLTAYELLTMYARLRGIPEERISPLVDNAVKQLNLTKWADRQCGTYSGGNKRKLGAAVALVGDPPIVFLDEPTSGMDPGARRFLWDVLANVMRAGRSIVLTSHSMEECEALCTRLAIMVNGQFKCLGSIQHLKSKFGQGYTIMLKVEAQTVDGQGPSAAATGLFVEPDTSAVQAFVSQRFTGAELLECHHGQLQYQVPGDRGLRLSEIFGQLQENRETLNIVDYSVSQTSLEQVFLNFARTQFTVVAEEDDELTGYARSFSQRSASQSHRPPSAATSPMREAVLPRSVSPANIVTVASAGQQKQEAAEAPELV